MLQDGDPYLCTMQRQCVMWWLARTLCFLRSDLLVLVGGTFHGVLHQQKGILRRVDLLLYVGLVVSNKASVVRSWVHGMEQS